MMEMTAEMLNEDLEKQNDQIWNQTVTQIHTTAAYNTDLQPNPTLKH